MARFWLILGIVATAMLALTPSLMWLLERWTDLVGAQWSTRLDASQVTVPLALGLLALLLLVHATRMHRYELEDALEQLEETAAVGAGSVTEPGAASTAAEGTAGAAGGAAADAQAKDKGKDKGKAAGAGDKAKKAAGKGAKRASRRAKQRGKGIMRREMRKMTPRI